MTLDATDRTVGDATLNRTLRRQRVLVIGGTSGMGLGAVRATLVAGAHVVMAGRRPETERPPVEAPDGRLSHAVVDVTDESQIRSLFDDVGNVDHLLVTAAPEPGSWGNALEQDVAGAQRYFNGKFWGSWASARYAAPRMTATGSITFLTGGMSTRPRPGGAIVTAAFAAVEALSRALALDLAPLRVNTIRPGLVASDMWNFLSPAAREEVFRKARESFPVGRVGQIEDIGHAAVFLMTNPFVTGSVLEVTGGEQLVAF
jgi:NAD(P)-dependent dehydrogenase (short-subunit alcohol dehydrogenase family)